MNLKLISHNSLETSPHYSNTNAKSLMNHQRPSCLEKLMCVERCSLKEDHKPLKIKKLHWKQEQHPKISEKHMAISAKKKKKNTWQYFIPSILPIPLFWQPIPLGCLPCFHSRFCSHFWSQAFVCVKRMAWKKLFGVFRPLLQDPGGPLAGNVGLPPLGGGASQHFFFQSSPFSRWLPGPPKGS